MIVPVISDENLAILNSVPDKAPARTGSE